MPGSELIFNPNKIYLLMNKPAGYVCSSVSDSHKTVYELLSPELQYLVKNAKRGERLHTVGRLDCDTSGLLLFTTDGKFSHKIAAQKSDGLGIPKTYCAQLQTPVPPDFQKEYIEQAAKGLTLPPEKKSPEQQAAPAKIVFLSPELCQITVYEGKFHEVRRIFRALGNEVISLQRISIGNIMLPKNLAPGEYRELHQEEIINANLFFDI